MHKTRSSDRPPKKTKTLHCPTGQLLFRGTCLKISTLVYDFLCFKVIAVDKSKNTSPASMKIDFPTNSPSGRQASSVMNLSVHWISKIEVGGSWSAHIAKDDVMSVWNWQFPFNSTQAALEFRCVYRYVYCRSFEAPAVKLPFDVPTCQDHHFEIPHPSEHVKKNNTFPGASPKNETVFISDLKKLTRFKWRRFVLFLQLPVFISKSSGQQSGWEVQIQV